MLRKAMSVMIITAALTANSAIADTLLVEGLNQAGDNTPQRGLDQASVNEEFGEPVQRKESIGEPPISSWEYPGYVVYFEHDRVLHTVAKR